MKKSNTPPVATVMVPCEQSPRFLSRKQLCEKLSLTFPFVWRLIRRGEFPEGRSIGRKPVWLGSRGRRVDAQQAEAAIQGFR